MRRWRNSSLNIYKILIAIFLFSACAQNAWAEKRVSVMTFNVENLFDTEHDPGKEDYQYLPLEKKKTKEHKAFCATIHRKSWRDQCLNADWSESKLKKKLKAIGDVIRVQNGGKGPDLVVMQEVENVAVLEMLRLGYLRGLGYGPSILVEGPDKRGIDIGMFSKLPLVSTPVIRTIPFKKKKFNKDEKSWRGILEATFELPGGERMVVFGVHFPAPYHPKELRKQAFKRLNELKDKVKGVYVLAAGDFNLTSAEDKKNKVLKNLVSPRWLISQKVGCKECPGSQYYPPKKEWSFLDMILLGKRKFEKGPWKVDPKSVRLGNQVAAHKTKQGWPRRFDLETGEGVSDHWPMYLEIVAP